MAGQTEYHRGDMEIGEQVSTFHGFIALSKWGSLVIATALIFLVLVFCAHAGFFQAAGAAIIVAVLGVLGLREKKAASH
jgi:hypothetical protein